VELPALLASLPQLSETAAAPFAADLTTAREALAYAEVHEPYIYSSPRASGWGVGRACLVCLTAPTVAPKRTGQAAGGLARGGLYVQK
jgi:hypothetical protein